MSAWIQRQPRAQEPRTADQFLARVQVAVAWTPKDLWAARGAPKTFRDDEVATFLDSCLTVVIAEGARSEAFDEEDTEG